MGAEKTRGSDSRHDAGFLVHPMPSVFVSALIVLDCPAAV
jgi:hypothetical protein